MSGLYAFLVIFMLQELIRNHIIKGKYLYVFKTEVMFWV